MGPRKAYPLGSAPPIRLGSARECRSWWSARPDARAAPVPSGCRNQLLEDGSRTSGAKYGTWRAWRCRLDVRSEEHTSELQSQSNLVCRLLLEKKHNTRTL